MLGSLQLGWMGWYCFELGQIEAAAAKFAAKQVFCHTAEREKAFLSTYEGRVMEAVRKVGGLSR